MYVNFLPFSIILIKIAQHIHHYPMRIVLDRFTVLVSLVHLEIVI